VSENISQDSNEFKQIVELAKKSKVGKHLPNALYVHISALSFLDPILQNYEKKAHFFSDKIELANLIKLHLDQPKISYLFYPNFDKNPHPFLQQSIIIDLENGTAKLVKYEDRDNRPILHRKETFVTSDYHLFPIFAHLTKCELLLGLLDKTSLIGFQKGWKQVLTQQKIAFVDHALVCHIDPSCSGQSLVTIERHKAAIKRTELSRPVAVALEAGLITPESTFFDYGCGYGGDIERIHAIGVKSTGWDPYYCPSQPKIKADIVNLGYIINVIEDLGERRLALIQAWELTEKVLIVAAQVLINDSNYGLIVYSDGVITNRNTFQKYYQQEELKNYIDQVLEVDSIPVGLGIYFVFRNDEDRENFRISRFHSRSFLPQILNRNFEEYEVMLTPLMQFFSERGRLPVNGELPLEIEQEIKQSFRSFKYAFHLILKSTNPEDWQAIANKRRDEILIYLALANFSERPTMRQLPHQIREDIKALFSNYREACALADMMLLSLRDFENIADYCTESAIGSQRLDSFWIHTSALEDLDPMLRLYEGCASRGIGTLEQANVIKFNLKQAKISYLYYPNFDSEAHPKLHTSMQIDLTELRVVYREFENDDNPPILHEKDSLVTPEYHLYEVFKKLTEREKQLGLLEDQRKISRLRGWKKCLKENYVTIKGHNLYSKKDLKKSPEI
jgi:DNA phosphorothioation-associated putative methyltransferase